MKTQYYLGYRVDLKVPTGRAHEGSTNPGRTPDKEIGLAPFYVQRLTRTVEKPKVTPSRGEV